MNLSSYNFTDDELIADAARFTTKRDWRKASKIQSAEGRHSPFRAAEKRGRDFFERCTSHMHRASPEDRTMPDYRYSSEDLVRSASKHKHIIDWKRMDPNAYAAARTRVKKRAGWKAEWWTKIVGHMSDWNQSAYQVYVYEFQDNRAYVGLTSNPEKRHGKDNGHKAKGSVFNYVLETGQTPEMKVIGDNMSGSEASDLESETIDRYVAGGWIMLNKTHGGSLGSIALRVTDDKVMASAAECKTRSEWLSKDQYAYKAAKKRGIFDACVAHMPGEHDLSTARCKANREPVSDGTRLKMSEVARLRFDQIQSNAVNTVLNNKMKTIILVGAQPVTHANSMACELAQSRNAEFLTPDHTATNWINIDNRMAEAPDGSVFIVTSAVPGRSIQRFMAAGFKVELADAGSAPGANAGSVNNYNCSVREAKRVLGILPPIKRKMADGTVAPGVVVPVVEPKSVVYALLDLDGRCLFAGITDHVPMARREAMNKINLALTSGIDSGDLVWLALAQRWGRLVTQFDAFFKIVAECTDETVAQAELATVAATVEKPSGVILSGPVDASAQVTESLAQVGLTVLPTKLRNMAVASFTAWGDIKAEDLFKAALRCQRNNPAVVSMAGTTYVFPMTVKELMDEVNKITEALK